MPDVLLPELTTQYSTPGLIAEAQAEGLDLKGGTLPGDITDDIYTKIFNMILESVARISPCSTSTTSITLSINTAPALPKAMPPSRMLTDWSVWCGKN